jgi:CDP-diglyceride synthetase
LVPDLARFIIFMAAAFLIFVAVLRFTIRARIEKPTIGTLVALGVVVVIMGMLFARYSHVTFHHLPWEVYYGLPALVTLLLPPIWLRMSRREVLQYLPLALLMAPAIHVIFSFFVGWHDYMPFPFPIRSLAEILKRSSH